MTSLSLLLLLTETHNSYAVAGSVSAAYVLMAAIGGPLQARLVDTLGQRAVLLPLSIINLLAKLAMVATVVLGAALPIPQLCAALGGATSPLVGSYVRARWSNLIKDKAKLRTAFALESALEEICAVAGPPLAAFLAVQVSPVAGLAVAIAACFGGTALLSLQRRTEPPVRSPSQTAKRDKFARTPLIMLCLAAGGLGVIFGSINVTVVAFTSEHDARGVSGLLLAIMAGSSILASLAVGAFKGKMSNYRQLQAGTIVTVAAITPLLFVSDSRMLAVVLCAVSFGMSPAIIATFSRVERIVPASRLSEGMAWVTSAMIGGSAAGNSISGIFIDLSGGEAGFLVSLIAGILSALLVQAMRLSARDKRGMSDPGT